MDRGRFVRWLALVGWLCGCAADGGQVAPEPNAPAPPPASASERGTPSTPVAYRVEVGPAAQDEAAAKPEEANASKVTWQRIDLGGSTVELPIPVETGEAPNKNDMPGAKFATADLGQVAYFAGDGPCAGKWDDVLRRLLRQPLQHSPPASMKRSRTEAKGFVEERRIIRHVNGSVTMGRFQVWPMRGGKPGRVAWRLATVAPGGEEEAQSQVVRFIDSLGPTPAGKTKVYDGLFEP